VNTPTANFETAKVLRRGIISGLIGLGVIILAAATVGRSTIDVAAMMAIAERTRLGIMFLSLVVMSLAFWLLGLRWRSLLVGPNRPPGTGLAAILCAGLLLNSALPGPVGEFGAAWFAHKRYRITLGESLAAGMGARIIGLIVAALAAAISFVVWAPPIPEAFQTAISATAAGVGLMGVGLIVVVAKPSIIVWCSVKSVARFERTRRAHEIVVEAATSMERLRAQGPGPIAACVGWSVVAHSTVVGGIMLAAWSLGASPSVSGLLFTYATTTAAVVIMFVLPGSAVGWDAIFLTLLTTTAGLSMPDALAVAVVVRIQQLCIMCAGGVAMAWLTRTETWPTHKEKSDNAPHTDGGAGIVKPQ